MTHIDYLNAIKQLAYWTIKYDEGNPEVSDAVWDKLYYEIATYEKEHPDMIVPGSPTQSISYDVVSKLKKVKHNHLMLSLAKTKDINEFAKFVKKSTCIIMPKFDGLTCSLKYENGKLVAAETRGNGEIGEDILHNAKVIKNIPQYINNIDTLVIDGEVICTEENFKPFSIEYKNPRNFAAGSLRLLDSSECAKRNLSFIAWDVIFGLNEPTLSNKLDFIKKLGFTISDYLIIKSAGAALEEAIESMKAWSKMEGYPIDGVVAKYDNIDFYNSLGYTAHHFSGGMAFKFYDETYQSKLRYIDWTMGRTGQLTPTAVFFPVDIDGTVVERASLHNVSIMRELLGPCAYYGEPVEIYKANQIIPQIASAGPHYDYGEVIAQGGVSVDNIEKCPICGAEIEFRQNGIAEICYCTNPNCEGKLINKLEHFCGKKGLDIKGISKATLEKLIDWNWIVDFESIYNLKNYRKDWIKKPGFGQLSVDKILQSIEDSKYTELWRIIAAAGIPEIGITASKTLANYYKTWDAFRAAVNNKEDFSHLPDFGYIMNRNIHSYDFEVMDNVAKYMIINAAAAPETKKTLDGITFCITGKVTQWKNRDSLKEYIESLGGKVTGSVTSKTNYLINNDSNSNTAKNVTAKKLNIPILTEENFVALVDELLAK